MSTRFFENRYYFILFKEFRCLIILNVETIRRYLNFTRTTRYKQKTKYMEHRYLAAE